MADSFLQKIEEKLVQLQKDSNKSSFDQVACLLLAKGVLLRNVGQNDTAAHCFETIIERQKEITRDTFLPPYAALELGITYFFSNRYDESLKWIKKAESNEKKFLSEALVHIRAHAFTRRIKEIKGSEHQHTHL
ncbi:Tetratricopeptide repeat protein 39B-like protein [Dinothrombium tinctorium]|uniref:Tetratricopeptide repeat protein 39B-like protein n=1 Tax=Dinothrombium tinctorium TaxID=1965070 RepID=A0A3S3NQ54_9ACAR|nr:Tetratricopeptide repeat protein 39B-like protein [Dinothrombium tinctorium]